MRPGDDRAAGGRRLALRHDDDSRNKNALVLQAGRPVKHPVGRGSKRRTIDALLANKAAGFAWEQ
jgi:hypothetical protein